MNNQNEVGDGRTLSEVVVSCGEMLIEDRGDFLEGGSMLGVIEINPGVVLTFKENVALWDGCAVFVFFTLVMILCPGTD